MVCRLFANRVEYNCYLQASPAPISRNSSAASAAEVWGRVLQGGGRPGLGGGVGHEKGGAGRWWELAGLAATEQSGAFVSEAIGW